MRPPNYQADLIRDVRPSTADVSGLAQATANEAAVAGAARAGLVQTLGGTIFEAYKGKELSDFEKKLEAERQGFVKPLEDAGKGLLAAEEKKKQGLLFAAQTAEDLYRGSIASDLEGRDPKLIEEQVAGMYAKNKSAILTEYEQKLKTYDEVLSNFPARQDEMMARSEALLKQYIARMPGMADEFRNASHRILGVKGIESFTTMQAYKAVEQFAAQREAVSQAAKKAAEEEEKIAFQAFQKANEQLGVDAFTSLQNWKNPKLRDTQIAVLRQQSKLRQQVAEEELELKAGNISLSSFINTSLSAYETTLATALPVLRSELHSVGLTDSDIEGGNLTPEQLRNPKIMGVLKKYSDMALQSINTIADKLRADLGQRVINKELKVGDVEYTRSLENIEKWRKTHIENTVGGKGTGLLYALELYSKKDERALANAQQTLWAYENLLKITDPEGYLRKQVAGASPEALARLVKENPQAALVQELMSNAARAITSPAEGFARIQEMAAKVANAPNFQTSSIPGNKAKNPEAVAVNAISYEAAGKAIRELAADPNEAIDQPALAAIKTIINGAASDAEYGTHFFKRQFSDLDALIKRASPADKEIIKQYVLTATTSSIYGFGGHGEALSKFLGELKTANPQKVSFIDTTGTSSLEFRADIKQPDLTLEPPLKGAGGFSPRGGSIDAMRAQGELRTAGEIKAAEKKINAALTHVDSALRLRARLNDESIIKLRQDFMQQVDKAYKKGIPISQVVAETLSSAQKPKESTSTPAAAGTTPVGQQSTEQLLQGFRSLQAN